VIVNPFNDSLALSNSNYSIFGGGRLTDRDTGELSRSLARFVHDGLRGLVLNDQFSCDGGKAALRRGTYAFGLYASLLSHGALSGLARDLYTFVTDDARASAQFTTFVASFEGPHPADEQEFERTLWRGLQELHDIDRRFHDWAPTVSADPDDPEFSFSFAGTAFFVVGLHAASSRAARRFAWPTVVFNPRQQFDDLRASGRYSRFQHVIRRAEVVLQGSTNPMLSDHGSESEARQYSGRVVEDGWRCPFHAKSAHEPTAD
jgi:FPC/CPF motif-containing protein YcgG